MWRSFSAIRSFTIRLKILGNSKFSSLSEQRVFSAMARPDLERVFSPPKLVGPMQALDRSLFTTEVSLVLALLKDVSYISHLNKKVPDDLLQVQGISRVVTVPQGKGVLLKHEIKSVEEALPNLSSEARQLLKEADASLVPHTLKLDYDYWKTDEILSEILPAALLEAEGGAPPSGFTAVGHVAHMNIKDEFLPYKKIIGQVILDKNSPSIRSVVNKLDSIDNAYRTFEMEVLAGDNDFEVEQSESGCRFQFNFAKVYWNSRLHTEHDRLIQQFKRGEAVADVFAGVGPFAVPAGKNNAIIFANDLNPESYKSLVHNIKLNKVSHAVFPSNLDGREFIKKSASILVEFQSSTPNIILPSKQSSASRSSKKTKVVSSQNLNVPKVFKHYVMNLPDSAITFLDGFKGLYADEALRVAAFGKLDIGSEDMPFIHVHCFHKADPHAPEPPAEEVHEALRQRCSDAMSYPNLTVEELSFHKVRKVAPTKIMYCITFRLPVGVAMAK